MRLIDADALKEKLAKMKIIIDEDVVECNSIYEELVYLLKKVDAVLAEKIDTLPTIEAVPVVYGEWKSREQHNDYLWAECSNCGFRGENYRVVEIGTSSIDYIGTKYHFCPKCGAKMTTQN